MNEGADGRHNVLAMPASREPLSLLSVDRSISELRRGRVVAIRGGEGRAVLACAAEAATPELLSEITSGSKHGASLALTARRASVLGLDARPGRATLIVPDEETGLNAETIRMLADPLGAVDEAQVRRILANAAVKHAAAYDVEAAAIALAKAARLLPAAIVADIADPKAEDLYAWAARHDLMLVDAGDVFQYEKTTARTLKPVSEARVPLEGAENTRIVAFRPMDGGVEHIAIVIGEPEAAGSVLVRIHSECFTGDLLASLRCDCGDQLRGAIREIAEGGAGVLLYLAQEGRGIGLVNKLRAYELQDRGFDTLDANEQLGFDADERVYMPAAQMLRQLGYRTVRLMTNNPDKVASLARFGVEVSDRVAHAFPSNKHNEQYLMTKSARGGHLF